VLAPDIHIPALTWCPRGSPRPNYTEKLTYAALWVRVARLATALVAHRGLLRRGQFMAVCGLETRRGWRINTAALARPRT